MKIPSIYYLFPVALGFALLVMTLHTTNLQASNAKPYSLQEIIDICGFAFAGECIRVKSGKDPQTGAIATWFTFRVHEPLYGEFDETFVIKQFGGQDDDTAVAMQAATYEEGQHLILFVYPPSRSGFTSAIGLTQGRFLITSAEDTDLSQVTNGSPMGILFPDADIFPAHMAANRTDAEDFSPVMTRDMDKKEFLKTVRGLIEQRIESEDAHEKE